MVRFLRKSDKAGSSILNTLKFTEFGVRKAKKYAVAGVKAGGNESVDKTFAVFLVEVFTNAADVANGKG